MDQNTMIAVGVGAVVLLFGGLLLLACLVGGGIWLANMLGKRRREPQIEEIDEDGPAASPGCECQQARTLCVGAELDEDDSKLVAIRVRRDGCCGGGRLNRKRIQRLVDRVDESIDTAEEREILDQLAAIAAEGTPAATTKRATPAATA